MSLHIRERYSKSFRRFIRNKDSSFGLIIVLLYSTITILTPIIAPYNPFQINLTEIRALPSWNHLLGTDELGRDIFSRILYGTKYAFYTGFVAVAIAFGIGVPLGLFAGYHEGKIGFIIMRVADILLCFPFLLLAITIVSFLGPGITNGIMAIGIGLIPVYTRLTNGMVLSIKEERYVEAAVMSGEKDSSILLRYILPNAISPVICQATLHLPKTIISSATLSFLGLGAQPPIPEWGAMITTAREYLLLSPHLALFPGLALMILVLGFNFFGDGLRDFLDPKLRTQAI